MYKVKVYIHGSQDFKTTLAPRRYLSRHAIIGTRILLVPKKLNNKKTGEACLVIKRKQITLLLTYPAKS